MSATPSGSAASRTFAHATLAEIYEQPRALQATLDHYLADGLPSPAAWQPALAALQAHHRLIIVASGSSRHAGMLAEIVFEDLCGIAVDVEYASEFNYRVTDSVLNPAILVISQSGETADTLAALQAAASRRVNTIAITNVPGSTMAREADASLLTYAGNELAIAATKSFTAQVAVLYLLGLALAHQRHRLDQPGLHARIAELLALPDLIRHTLPDWETNVARIAQAFDEATAFLYLGRAVHYPIAREGALKLKETSYVHAEAYPAGELKHGPNALLAHGSPVVVLATRDLNDEASSLRYEKTIQLLRDIHSQKTHIFAIATEGDTEIASLATHVVYVPAVAEYLLPLLEIIPLQLFAYFMSLRRGYNVDQPRNLVKAVLVE